VAVSAAGKSRPGHGDRTPRRHDLLLPVIRENNLIRMGSTSRFQHATRDSSVRGGRIGGGNHWLFARPIAAA